MYSYFLKLYAAAHRLGHMTSFFSIVDLISVVPMWIELGLSQETVDQMRTVQEKRQFLSLLQVMKSLRILRAHRLLRFASSTVQRQILTTILTVLSIVIGLAGVLQIVEQCATQCPYDCQEKNRGDTLKCSSISLCNSPTLKQYLCCSCQDRSFFDWVYFVVVSALYFFIELHKVLHYSASL